MPPYAEEMGGDEIVALIASAAIGLPAAISWWLCAARVSKLGARTGIGSGLAALPLACGLLLYAVLARYAAVEVRTDIRYQALFLAMGTVWIFLLPRLLALAGISYRDDALERRNPAAALAVAGAVVGLTLLFAGGNMGEGPSIWNTVATAVAATAVFFALLFGVALAARVGDSVALERDVASGLRFGALAAACGLVLGRASAGDWVSAESMIRDLIASGWPAGALALLAGAVEFACRPGPSNPRPSVALAGALPALAYLASSITYVVYL